MSSQPSDGKLSSNPLFDNGTQLILSVDDEPAILLTREKILENAGYDVLSAGNGEQALRLFAEHPVKLVLLDFLMPGMDGGMVARQMKRAKPAVPVVLVSASPIPEEFTACVDCRIDKGDGPLTKTLCTLAADVIPEDATAKFKPFKQFADLLECSKGNSQMHPCKRSVLGRPMSEPSKGRA